MESETDRYSVELAIMITTHAKYITNQEPTRTRETMFEEIKYSLKNNKISTDYLKKILYNWGYTINNETFDYITAYQYPRFFS